MFLFVLSLISASAEFPICTASGDQLYPDVCWDGSAFWVVWQDEDEGTIRGVRVSEDGELLTDEVELLEKGPDPGPVRYPCVAAAPDRFAVEARVMAGYDEFGNERWGVMHREFSFSGVPLYEVARIRKRLECLYISVPIVLFGKNHFFSLFKANNETPEDFHSWSKCVGLDSGGATQQDIWLSSTVHGEFLPSVGCWDGERFLIITSCWDSGVFLEDSMIIQGIGWDYQLGREFYTTIGEPIKYQTLVSNGGYFFLASEIWSYLVVPPLEYKVSYDILDSTGIPLKDSATIVDLGDEIKLCYPDAAYGKENFVCCWENRFDDNTVHLYAIEVDTLGEILDSGYVRYDAPVEQQPAIAFGNESYLLVWSDNKDGDFNIRGLVFDTLELFDGISEPATPPLTHPATIAVDQTVFTDRVEIHLSAAAEQGSALVIHDALGRVVRRIEVKGRSYSCVWDGRDSRGDDAGEGVYFVSLAGKTRNARLKVIKIK